MMFDVSHRTHYQYSQPVIQSQHLVHMSPRPSPRQVVRHHSLIIDPAPALRQEGVDAFGNPTVTLDIEVPHRELILHARSTITVHAPENLQPARSTPWNLLDAHILGTGRPLDLDVVQYRCASRLTTPNLDIESYAAKSFRAGRPVLDGAIDLNQRIFDEFTFDPTATDISTPLSQVFKQRRGVCQDFAHLALACLRAMRIPARYVSGYILTHPPPGQPRMQGADASHAWISVWSPEAGWTDLDPTNGLVVADEHITIAHGRDYDDVSPIGGVLLGGGEHHVSVGVDVVPILS
jgi:transglutaminase-like putative cysteine protease